jgi:hypothetical protein
VRSPSRRHPQKISVLLNLGFASFLACVLPAHADSVTTSTANGFARLLFTLSPPAHATANADGGVLTISFDRKVALDPAKIAENTTSYVSSIRADADGKTFHLALAQPARVHSSASGDRIAVDLVPQGFDGTPRDLAPPPTKAATIVDPAKLDALKVRTGAYHNFTRIVFDWPRNVPYAVFQGAGRLTVRFEALAHPDFSALARQMPPWVKNAAWHVAGQGIIVELETDADSGYHDFRDGSHVVLDVLAPKTDADAYAPPGAVKGKRIPVALPKRNAVTGAQAEAIATTAAKLNPAPPIQTSAPVQAAASPAPVAPQPQATPIPQSLPADGQVTRDGAILVLNGASRSGSAIFVRGMTAWIVLQDAPPLDAARLRAQLGTFPAAVDATNADGVSVLRIGLRRPEQIAAFAEGTDLKVVIGQQVSANALAIGFARNFDDPAHASLSTLIGGATHPVRLADPVAGDEIIVVPATPGRAMAEERHFPEFAALKTASGLVLQPFVDDLSVAANAPRVTISRPEGLSLTAAAVPANVDSPAALAGHTQSYLDLESWRHAGGGSFLAAERRMRASAARLKPEHANRARLVLAQFYLANDFAAEALGVIRLMQASDPALASNRQLLVMRAAANYEMGRYRDAHNDLAGSAFDSDRHAALWRGLTEAALEDWGAALADLDRASPVLHLYPVTWQARARIATADAALGSRRPELADAALARLPDETPASLMRAAQLQRARLCVAENRDAEAAQLFAAVERGGDDREAARAAFYRIDAALSEGSMAAPAAIAALEDLRYRWRGDLLELKILRRLSALYFSRQQWRDGLHMLRLAAQGSPSDDGARQAQDDMRAAFIRLFLKGDADRMAPVQALSLFYENIDLTPIGPDGDEMIRRMADRLSAVDLLGPAADLLKYQIDKRLEGVARAQVATKLAAIYLLDRKPERALDTIRATSIATLPDDVLHQRLLLQARALADLRRWDDALELIAVDSSTDVARLRADIYWRSGNWALAGQKAEEALSRRWNDNFPLTIEDRQQVMRAAVAYSLANDEPALDRLRQHFALKMKSGPDARAFEVVSARIDDHGIAFRNAAAQVASIDVLQGFMKDIRAQAARTN